jgi:hypothetical protein
MGVDISDLQDRRVSIHASWWQWRPAVELIRVLALFDTRRLEHLSDGFGEFSAAEAHQLADRLEQGILSSLTAGQRVLLNGTVTDHPDDGIFHREPENQHQNCSLDYDWLNRFVAFCRASRGLYIS